jgi:hypothetical protein
MSLRGATTFSIMTFSITTFSIMTLSITTFSIMTLSIKTYSIMLLSIKYHSAECRNYLNVTASVVILNVFTLNVVAPTEMVGEGWYSQNLFPSLIRLKYLFI